MDSVARALALPPGMVDVVFWTKGMPSETAGMTDEECAAYVKKEMEGLPELKKALLRTIDVVMTCTERSRMGILSPHRFETGTAAMNQRIDKSAHMFYNGRG